MASALIKDVNIINPAKNENYFGDILMADGKIAQMAEHIDFAADEVIEGRGLVAAPGFVDIHVHLRDPGLCYKEDIISGCKAAAAGGVTSLLCMPNTKPSIDNPETVEYILNKAKDADAKVYVASAITRDLGGDELVDLAAMKAAGAVALSDDGRPVVDTRCLVKAMTEGQKMGMRVVAHCEDLFLASKWYLNEGETSEKLGLPGVPNAAEDCGTAREIAVAAAYNVPIHICHVSTKGSCELIRDARRRGVEVTGETAAHYLLLTDRELLKKDADYRMNPPLRSEEDRLALIEAIKDGTLTVLATDHAPHSVEEKADFLKAPNGSIGMETSFSGNYTALVKTGAISLDRLIELMSVNPAGILGIDAGVLEVGRDADIVLIDPNEEWTVDVDRLHGKSKNAVLKNMRLVSKVKKTFLRGKLVFAE